MKSYLKSFISKVVCLILFSTTCSAQLFEFPFVLAQSDLNMIISSVEVGEDTTTFDLIIVNLLDSDLRFWINPKGADNAYYLENSATKATYKFLGQDGKWSKSNPCVLKTGEDQKVRMYFEKIPNTYQQYNLIEGPKDNSWDFVGIDLNKKFDGMTARLTGRRCYTDVKFKQPINFLLSETYRARYYGEITDTNPSSKGKMQVNVDNVEIIDPSWVSVNYLEYKQSILNLAKQDVGGNRLFNEQEVKIVIFE